MGDYLFQDADFVGHLSTKHRNIFQKIYDEIKYLCKIVTAGSKEALQLEKVKKAFDEAYRASKSDVKENTAENSGVKHSIVALEDGKVYVDASRNVITGKTKAEQRKNISDFFSVLLDGNDSLDIPTLEGDVLTITKAETANKARDDYKSVNGKAVKMTDEEFTVKMHVEAHIDEIAEASKPSGGKEDSKNHSFAKDGFTYRRAYFKDFDGQYYEVTLSIGNNGTVATVYNVGKIKEGVSPSAKILAVVGSKPLGDTPSSKSIPQSVEKVNTKLSLSSGQSEDVDHFGLVDNSADRGSRSLDKFTEKQYNSFGWARDTGAITKNELDDMYSKIHVKGSLKGFAQTSYGEAIIEVNDDPYALAANNVFAFVKGTKNNPEITRVVRVNFSDEASIDLFRKDIYENTGYRTLETYARRIGEEYIQYYDRSHYADYRAYTEKSRAQRSGSGSKENTPVDRNGDQRSGSPGAAEADLIAPIKKASSSDDVFFDAENANLSLSANGEQHKRYGTFFTPASEVMREIAPVREDMQARQKFFEAADEYALSVDDIGPVAPAAVKTAQNSAEVTEASFWPLLRNCAKVPCTRAIFMIK